MEVNISEDGMTLFFNYRLNTQSSFAESGVSDILNVTLEPISEKVIMLKLTEKRHISPPTADFIIEVNGIHEGDFRPFRFRKEHTVVRKDNELLIHVELMGQMFSHPRMKDFFGEIDITVTLNNYKPENSISVAFSDDVSS